MTVVVAAAVVQRMMHLGVRLASKMVLRREEGEGSQEGRGG